MSSLPNVKHRSLAMLTDINNAFRTSGVTQFAYLNKGLKLFFS